MNIKPIIVTLTTDLNHPGLVIFKKTLERAGIPYHIIHQVIPPGTHVFGTQMPLVYNWCKSTSYTHMIYADAWDSYVVGDYEELITKLPDLKWWGSVEKNCFLHPELAKDYPSTEHDWKYVNGGGWFSEVDFFRKMVENNPINRKNDQLWLAEVFLKNKKEGLPVGLDYNCEVFQTTGFEGPNDFLYNYEVGRITNLKTGSLPMIFHGNGRTDMSKVIKLEQFYTK